MHKWIQEARIQKHLQTLRKIVLPVNDFKYPNHPQQNSASSIPRYGLPCMYSDDFNHHNTDWGYKKANADGEALSNWASANIVQLLFNQKQPDSFYSCRWVPPPTLTWYSSTLVLLPFMVEFSSGFHGHNTNL